MHPSPVRACPTTFLQQPICILPRLTFVSVLVVLTFTVCIIQEFTFILNYSSSGTTSDSLDKSVLSKPVTVSEKQWQHFDDWRKVTDNIYIYSAYWDKRFPNESFVRIVGGASSLESDQNSTKCMLRVHQSSTILEVPADYEVLVEHHNMFSKAVYIKCTVPDGDLPTWVAVVPVEWNNTFEPSWIAVQELQRGSSLHTIGICVRPIFNFNNIFRISEFIAYYETLGASRFTFYNYNASEDVIRYFRALKEENYSIDVLPWSLPPSLNGMWAIGQLASINDCIYRSMNQMRYVVIVDLDEFITPRHVMTLRELMQIQDVPSKYGASFILRSCVFCEEYEQDILPSVILPFKSQSSVRREKFIYPFLIRSKYIVKPHLIEEAGVHHVWRTLPGWEERFIPISHAIVHHYRENLCTGENKTLEKGEVDVKSRKYLNPLMRSKAVAVWRKLFFH